MLFGTFQPLKDDPSKRDKHLQVLEDHLGYYPIFCFPARTKDEVLWGAWLATPKWPERFILFESSTFDRMDMILWNEIDFENDNYNPAPLFANVRERYAEYLVPEITNIVAETTPHGFIFDAEFTGVAKSVMDNYQSLTQLIALAHGGANDQRSTLVSEKDAFVRFLMQFFYLGVMNDGKIQIEEAWPFGLPTLIDSIRVLQNNCAKLLSAIVGREGQDKRTMFDEMYDAMTVVQQEHAKTWALAYLNRYVFKQNDSGASFSSGNLMRCHLNPKIELRIGA